VVYNIVHSDIGRALVSIREDELAAEAMGINTTRYKVLASLSAQHWRAWPASCLTYTHS